MRDEAGYLFPALHGNKLSTATGINIAPLRLGNLSYRSKIQNKNELLTSVYFRKCANAIKSIKDSFEVGVVNLQQRRHHHRYHMNSNQSEQQLQQQQEQQAQLTSISERDEFKQDTRSGRSSHNHSNSNKNSTHLALDEQEDVSTSPARQQQLVIQQALTPGEKSSHVISRRNTDLFDNVSDMSLSVAGDELIGGTLPNIASKSRREPTPKHQPQPQSQQQQQHEKHQQQQQQQQQQYVTPVTTYTHQRKKEREQFRALARQKSGVIIGAPDGECVSIGHAIFDELTELERENQLLAKRSGGDYIPSPRHKYLRRRLPNSDSNYLETLS